MSSKNQRQAISESTFARCVEKNLSDLGWLVPILDQVLVKLLITLFSYAVSSFRLIVAGERVHHSGARPSSAELLLVVAYKYIFCLGLWDHDCYNHILYNSACTLLLLAWVVTSSIVNVIFGAPSRIPGWRIEDHLKNEIIIIIPPSFPIALMRIQNRPHVENSFQFKNY